MTIALKLSIFVLVTWVVVANAKYIDNLSKDALSGSMDRVKRASSLKKRQTSFESYENLEAQEDVVLRPLFVQRLLNRNRNDQRRRFVNPIFLSGASENKKLKFDDRPNVMSPIGLLLRMFLSILIASILISAHCSPLPRDLIDEDGSKVVHGLRYLNSDLEVKYLGPSPDLGGNNSDELLEPAENGVVFRPLFAYRKLLKKKATIRQEKLKNYQTIKGYSNFVLVPVTLY